MQGLNTGYYRLKADSPPRQVILAFRGEFRFLSNFFTCCVTLPAEGELPAMEFDSVEQAYMAWKTLDQETRKKIQEMKPGQAKKLSKQPDFPLREDYTDEGRLATMLNLNRQKFSLRNPELRQQLLATEEALLIEGNDWGDSFFGFDLKSGCGQNHLGRILMRVRQEARSSSVYSE